MEQEGFDWYEKGIELLRTFGEISRLEQERSKLLQKAETLGGESFLFDFLNTTKLNKREITENWYFGYDEIFDNSILIY